MINNLVSTFIDNHIHFGNALNIDLNSIFWRRCIDLNDRSLKDITVKGANFERTDHFIITAASEVMAILTLAKDLADFRSKLARAVFALDKNGSPLTISQLGIVGALMALATNMLLPNLVQTTHGLPALVHGGPFANIAHGCNSIIATNQALTLADYVVCEAGFGFDLGGEKFCDIACRVGEFKPDCIVLVVTIKALIYHGIGDNDLDKLISGINTNLHQHLTAISNYNVAVEVVLNLFNDDQEEHIQVLKTLLNQRGINLLISQAYQLGGAGCLDIARSLVNSCSRPSQFKHLYDLDLSIVDKITTICQKIYGAKSVVFTDKSKQMIEFFQQNHFDKLPICIAKTPLSFSDDANCAYVEPGSFTITITNMYVSAGAGFIVALAGNILQMPGLNQTPQALNIDVDKSGNIVGLK